jgi:hypothetical protein
MQCRKHGLDDLINKSCRCSLFRCLFSVEVEDESEEQEREQRRAGGDLGQLADGLDLMAPELLWTRWS